MYCQSAHFSCTSASCIYPLTHLISSRTPQNQHRLRSLACTRTSSKNLSYTLFFPGRFNNTLSAKVSQPRNTIRCSREVLSASADSQESPGCCVVDSGQSRVGALEAARVSKNCCRGERNGVLDCLSKPLAFAVLSLLLGLCPIPGWQSPVLATPATVQSRGTKKDERGVEKNGEGNKHEYSEYTRRLLQKVSVVFKAIEDVRSSKGTLRDVEASMDEVKSTARELRHEVMNELNGLMRGKGLETEGLIKRSEALEASLSDAEDERQYTQRRLRRAFGGDKDAKKKIKSLEKQIDSRTQEYNALQERLEQIEDQLSRKEGIALNVGVRELIHIERECELFVKKFINEMESKSQESVPKASAVGLSRLSIKKDLEANQRQILEQQAICALSEDGSEPLSDEDSENVGQRIQQVLTDSSKLQEILEARVREDMQKFGDEKRFLVNTPLDEVVKGFPEAELKWMFGNKEVVIPKAIRIHLLNGWKKWREERKTEFKKELLQNVDRGKLYVKQKQECIILDRDRVMSKTVFDEEKNRWEIDPVAVPYAVSKNLVEYACIRPDMGAMFIAIKGDDKEYYVDVEEYETLFEDFGGFDGLYLKMLASGTPTSIQLMPIPLSELNLYQQFLLMIMVPYKMLKSLLKIPPVSFAKDWIIETIKSTNDEILVTIVFPVAELVVPYSVRIRCGMAWREDIDQAVGVPWYLKWQSDIETRLMSKKEKNKQQNLWMLIRFFIYGYVLFYAFGFARRYIQKLVRFLGFRDVFQGPSARKLRKVRAYSRFFLSNYVRKMRHKRKDKKVDPIKKVFENMKRIRNPSIPLSDFSNVESVREEINEVIQFLRNPYVFQKLGARAPRGVLIVGDKGTGKRSLALAIAAEAKVPVVTVKPEQLEAATLVGQSAANVRELFKTARDLAPVIILVEDFDRFAGVRGKLIHTQKQDHEAFINQLLVELDGFEKQDGVVLLATTSDVEQIDPALKRPGRMDRIFYLEPPSLAEREKILRIAAKDTMDPEFVDFVDWSKVAEKTALASPTDLHHVPVALEGSAFRNKFLDSDELLSYCSWIALFSRFVPIWIRRMPPLRQLSCILVNHLGLGLTKEDVQETVDLMEPYGQLSGGGMELLNPPANWTRQTKLPHAVWASGRGLIAFLLPNFDTVDHIWLQPSSWEGIGCTKITKSESMGPVLGKVETISYLEKKLVFCFGSLIASQMLLPVGEETNLCSAEIKKAQQIATRMVLHYGWGPDESPVIYSHKDLTAVMSLGNWHQFEVAERVDKIYSLAYGRAKEMLQKNRRVLEKIVDELLTYNVVSGKDMARIHEENGGVKEKEPFFLSRIYETKPLSVDYLNMGSSSGTSLSHTTT